MDVSKKRIRGFYYLMCSCRVSLDWLRKIYDHPRSSCLRLDFSDNTAACSHSNWPGCFITFLISCTSSAFVNNIISELMIIPVTISPDSKFHGANMGPIWGRQDPGGPHVGPMNFVIWEGMCVSLRVLVLGFRCLINKTKYICIYRNTNFGCEEKRHHKPLYCKPNLRWLRLKQGKQIVVSKIQVVLLFRVFWFL